MYHRAGQCPATDVLGKSGRDMLEALMGGEQDAEVKELR
jgi:hypothetical protein